MRKHQELVFILDFRRIFKDNKSLLYLLINGDIPELGAIIQIILKNLQFLYSDQILFAQSIFINILYIDRISNQYLV